jgi:hypothetical protein
MGDHCDQRPVLIAEGYADDERGPGLAGHAEIDKPDLTAQRDRHLVRRGIETTAVQISELTARGRLTMKG